MRSESRRMLARKSVLLPLEIGVPLLAIGAWWFLSYGSTNPFFPSLSTIVTEFFRLWIFDHMVSDIFPSMGNFLLSYLIACVAGVILGTLLGLVKPLFWTFDPAMQIIRGIPAVALLPIFIAILGFGNEVRVFVIALAALFPVLISTVDGIRATEPLLIDSSRVYKLTWWERLRFLYLPSASPQIFGGMVVSLQVAFIVMITSEMLGAARGVGAMTLMAQKSFDTLGMWAGIVLLGLLGYLVNVLFNVVRRRALSWYIGAQRAASSD